MSETCVTLAGTWVLTIALHTSHIRTGKHHGPTPISLQVNDINRSAQIDNDYDQMMCTYVEIDIIRNKSST